MIFRFEIMQNEFGNPVLEKVEQFEVNTDNGCNLPTIMYIMNECYSLDRLNNEHVYIVSLDYYGRIIGVYLVSIGTYKQCCIDNRSIACFLALSGAKKFIMIHNHPDDKLEVSYDDLNSSNEIEKLALILGVEFDGSYIVGKSGWLKADKKTDIVKWEEYDYER